MVIPELSNGLQNRLEGYRLRLERDYPSLVYDNFILIPNGTKIIIDDVGVRQDKLAQMASALDGQTYVYSQYDLVRYLEKQLEDFLRTSEARRIAYVFPGQGARSVQQMLDGRLLEGSEAIDIDIGRKLLPNGGISGIDTDTDKIEFETNPELVVVIDDVVASGATAAHVREMCNAANAEYIVAPLMMLSPVQNMYTQYQQGWGEVSLSGVRGYNQVQTPLLYQGQSGIPPVNSLSTLISDTKKGQVVREKYAGKYAINRDSFELALQTLLI